MPIEPAKFDAHVDPAAGALPLRIPHHIGVTMDGNGRWAEARGKPRTEGHLQGIKSLRRLIEYTIRFEIPYLTVFSFSSENWRRPKSEIEFIFNLLRKFVESDLKSLTANNVRVRILGERDGLETGLQKIITHVEKTTAKNTGLNLNVAFNYGGRSEIASAAKKIAANVQAGKVQISEINEGMLADALFTSGMPDPDLLIRTGGEQRTSNFLVWQSVYAELVFLNVLWPDFSEKDFLQSLEIYSARQRRFGGIEAVE